MNALLIKGIISVRGGRGMKICLFGISNVGKTTVGKLLAERLDIKFVDLDEEVKNRLKISLEEFVNTENLRWRDQKRGSIIKKVIETEEDLVFAISPISYIENFKTSIISDDNLLIELYDTPENIFSRLIFSDENDDIYTDDNYKNANKDYYMKEIQEDLDWYGMVNAKIGIHNRVFVNNKSPEEVVDRIIMEYNLENDDCGE